VAETGGQNCMVVDSTALLEQVVSDVISSAFEAAGQRCSALRVLCVQENIADQLLDMLLGAMCEIRLGSPSEFHTDVGPVIDARALSNIEAHIELFKNKGRKIHRYAYKSMPNFQQGNYVVPTVIELESISELTSEIFGPVLHFVRYKSNELEDLLKQINGTGYALTLGIHSRNEETIDRIIKATNAGNVYVNRNTVGAVVGVQPFGGDGLSGTGPKAGGPLYLLRLLSEYPENAVFRSLQSFGSIVSLPNFFNLVKILKKWAIDNNKKYLEYCCDKLIGS
jgi:RHH-type proline utilization regulon transcriptional repressor/proline dehydrogenase/delta 1-pyrroline-5-carboxylate dehydrogenase